MKQNALTAEGLGIWNSELEYWNKSWCWSIQSTIFLKNGLLGILYVIM